MASPATALHRQRAHDLRERGHALPGAAAALATLADTNAIVQSVVTGNIRPVAEIKLQVFGLDTHIQFPYGGYGEDHDDRAELVRTAIARIRAGTGTDVALTDVLLIGDTSADVAAGRAAGIPVLAVATGRTSAAELADAGATATVRDRVIANACGWPLDGCPDDGGRDRRDLTGCDSFFAAATAAPAVIEIESSAARGQP